MFEPVLLTPVEYKNGKSKHIDIKMQKLIELNNISSEIININLTI
jgi:hypothetical protein